MTIPLPKFILDKLPLWSYECPSCHNIVEETDYKCRKCGASFTPLQSRVPWYGWKNKKVLSDFIHKEVIPKVPKYWQNYLFERFTILFSDGFETNDLTAWTGSYTTAGETIATSTDYAHHGTYSVKCTSNGGGGSEAARVYETVNLSELYMRAYVYITQNGIADAGDYIAFISLRAGTNELAMLGWYNNAGTLSWWLRNRNAAAYVSTYSTSETTNLGQWYCIELYWQNAASATVQGYVNGVKILERTAQDTDNYGNCDTIYFGLGIAYNTASNTVYGDCVVVADAYIKCEVAYIPWHRLKDRGGEARSHIVFRRGLKDRVGG
jgi:hypothetical protein